jgi:hypothetical protein
MLCCLCLWISPGFIQIMHPHHLSALLVVLGCQFNLGYVAVYSGLLSSTKNILNITYNGLRPGDLHLKFSPHAPHTYSSLGLCVYVLYHQYIM